MFFIPFWSTYFEFRNHRKRFTTKRVPKLQIVIANIKKIVTLF